MSKIVGHGDIAQVLQDVDKDVLFFASGVSNSLETRESEYQREKDLLSVQDDSRRIVYFGSLSIFYDDTRYAQHKREMEQLVREHFPQHCIFRIGNITWGENPHTLINTLRTRVDNQEPILIRDVDRYVVELDEFLHWIDLIPEDFNCDINVPGNRLKVREIVKRYVL